MRTAILNLEMDVLRMLVSPQSSGTSSSVKSEINIVLFQLMHLGVCY